MTAGIICEYNPFHEGHAYHIKQTRLLGAEYIVCVMSGNFVQRADAAIYDKWTRAESAIRGGADIVVELPVQYAIASAQRFAAGGMGIIKALGFIDFLSFGSESGDIELIKEAATVVRNADIKSELKRGVSFAQARTESVPERYRKILRSRNDNLGVEYINAYAPNPVCVQRLPGISASEIRKTITDGASLLNLERAILARMRTISPEELRLFPDVSEGIEARLIQASRSAVSLEELYSLSKTKRYAHSRIRRIILSAFLNITIEIQDKTIEYIRILAFNSRGTELLSRYKKIISVPVITKPADYRELLAVEASATDLYYLSTPEVQHCGKEFTTSPVLVKNILKG